MFKRLLFSSATLLLAGVVFAQAYKWTDENGIVHYSDRPHPGAEMVQLASQRSSSPSSVSTPSATYTHSAANSAPDKDDKPFSYTTLEIASPAPEETLWNIEGTLNVSINVSPALKSGHTVRAYFDGAPHKVTSTSFQIDEVYRGSHNLQAEILDETGKLLIRSQPSRFYVQQTTIARAP